MNEKHAYIPDVSSFFGDGKKYSVRDIINRKPIEQETVTFEKNDISAVVSDSKSPDKGRYSMRNCRKKSRGRRINGKFKRS